MPAQTQVLAMIRRVTGTFLTDRCDVEAETAARGDFGEPLHAWSSVASNQPCRLILIGRRYNSSSEVAAAQETMVEEYRLIVARDVALAVDQRITISGVVYNLVRFEIQLTDEAFHSAILMRR